MNKRTAFLFIIVFTVVAGVFTYLNVSKRSNIVSSILPSNPENYGGLTNQPNPLSIEYMREQEYPGSKIVIEQTLPPGSNYDRYIASYKSDGLKIYALLTVPQGEKPETGWPVIVFNHGYIQPEQYRTTEKYIAYTDAFSRNGYIVFKSDYRGHGNSEGNSEFPEYSPAYTIDILNAISSLKRFEDADPMKIGMWGHSMGGTIVMRSLVVSNDIKAAEIWAGVVGTYQDLAENHHGRYANRPHPSPEPGEPTRRPNGRTLLAEQYGDINTNPKFWASIDPMSFIKDVTAPVQIQHGTADEEVPLVLSEKLNTALSNAGKTVKFYTYEGDDHNLSYNLDIALQRSVDFFDKYLKN
ncbi:alpha/beta hydrolase [Candidatus Beckwithbacteria bacterium CG10_big_fil_rev_8_21_14_0_10_34_10]|uniref:Alpha/beta hydrolase n=1 Tax=Candidatus Beckwithbacteria bacterium CG10_big_fil_rev_8_21_14_0_10_34_10 TaxID=1974495 RepID=A0A2H0W9Z7_9BACT|nr:MAG: alpha/beta hydrolase [Candidatus Beckwithbacteria bacterium CG10_big_fil_rev_8_21_14_0_10_34_10]